MSGYNPNARWQELMRQRNIPLGVTEGTTPEDQQSQIDPSVQAQAEIAAPQIAVPQVPQLPFLGDSGVQQPTLALPPTQPIPTTQPPPGRDQALPPSPVSESTPGGGFVSPITRRRAIMDDPAVPPPIQVDPLSELIMLDEIPRVMSPAFGSVVDTPALLNAYTTRFLNEGDHEVEARKKARIQVGLLKRAHGSGHIFMDLPEDQGPIDRGAEWIIDRLPDDLGDFARIMWAPIRSQEVPEGPTSVSAKSLGFLGWFANIAPSTSVAGILAAQKAGGDVYTAEHYIRQGGDMLQMSDELGKSVEEWLISPPAEVGDLTYPSMLRWMIGQGYKATADWILGSDGFDFQGQRPVSGPGSILAGTAELKTTTWPFEAAGETNQAVIDARRQNALGTLLATAIILAEPDAPSLTLGGAGYGFRVARLASKTKKINTLVTGLRGVADRAGPIDKMSAEIAELDPTAGVVLQAKIGVDDATFHDPAEEAARTVADLKKLEDKVAQAEINLDNALTVAEKERAEATLGRVRLEQYEARIVLADETIVAEEGIIRAVAKRLGEDPDKMLNDNGIPGKYQTAQDRLKVAEDNLRDHATPENLRALNIGDQARLDLDELIVTRDKAVLDWRASREARNTARISSREDSVAQVQAERELRAAGISRGAATKSYQARMRDEQAIVDTSAARREAAVLKNEIDVSEAAKIEHQGKLADAQGELAAYRTILADTQRSLDAQLEGGTLPPFRLSQELTYQPDLPLRSRPKQVELGLLPGLQATRIGVVRRLRATIEEATHNIERLVGEVRWQEANIRLTDADLTHVRRLHQRMEAAGIEPEFKVRTTYDQVRAAIDRFNAAKAARAEAKLKYEDSAETLRATTVVWREAMGTKKTAIAGLKAGKKTNQPLIRARNAVNKRRDTLLNHRKAALEQERRLFALTSFVVPHQIMRKFLLGERKRLIGIHAKIANKTLPGATKSFIGKARAVEAKRALLLKAKQRVTTTEESGDRVIAMIREMADSLEAIGAEIRVKESALIGRQGRSLDDIIVNDLGRPLAGSELARAPQALQDAVRAETAIGHAILLAWRDADYARKGDLPNLLRQAAASFDTFMNPIRARVGDFNKAVHNLVKIGDNQYHRAQSELVYVADESKTPIKSMQEYIDGNAPMDSHAKSHTNANVHPDGSAWFRTRRMLMDDPRWKQEVPPEGTEALDRFNRIKDGANNPILIGLARMFLAGGHTTPPRVSGELIAAAKKAIEESATFGEFGRKMHKTMGGRAIPAEGPLAIRAWGMGSSLVMAGAVQSDMLKAFGPAIGGRITVEQAKAVNALLKGDYDNANIDLALDAMNRMGAPPGQRRIRPEGADFAEVSKELIEAQNGVFIPKALVDDFNTNMDHLIKELDAYSATSKHKFLSTAWRYSKAGLSAWRRSVTMGLILPNAKYWFNNIVGDFSQLWAEEGGAYAARMSFQNMPNNIPWLGHGLGIALSDMSKRMGGAPVLGSAFNALWNPNLGDIFAGRAGSFKAADGVVYTFDDLRRMARDDGIMETFATSEMRDAFTRAARRGFGASNWNVLNRVRKHNDTIGHHATVVQQRQRMAMYVDLIQKGVGREEAKRRVLAALYDWNHSLGKIEAEYIAAYIPFYRFWKEGMRQSFQAVHDPLTKVNSDYMLNALTGRTKLARIRKQVLVTKNIGQYLFGEDDDVIREMELREQHAAQASVLRPAWAQNRGGYNIPLTPDRMLAYSELTGQPYTHEFLSMNPLTLVDTFSLVGSTAQAIAALGAITYEMTTGEQVLADDYAKTITQPLLNMQYSFVGDPMKNFLHAIGAIKGIGVPQSAWITMTPGERETFGRLSKIPGFSSAFRDHKDRPGQLQLETGPATLMRLIPFLGTQLPGIVDAAYAKNPAWKEGPIAGTSYMFRRLTGVLSPTPQAPMRDLARQNEEIQAAENEALGYRPLRP